MAQSTDRNEEKRVVSKFRYEKELQAMLPEMTLDVGNVNMPFTFWRREVNMGWCIPDMVYVRFNEIPDRKLWPRNASTQHARLIWILRQYGIQTLESIAQFLNATLIVPIERALTDLIRAKTVIEADGQYQLSEEFQRKVVGEVISIEAKLKKWQRALEQAISYKEWSDYVAVAMDAAYVPSQDSALSQFQNAGVGLCSLSPDSRAFDWVILPKKIEQQEGCNKEYLMAATVLPRKRDYWELTNCSNAAFHAVT